MSAIWLTTSTLIFTVSVQRTQYNNIALQCKYEKKFKMTDFQSAPESQLKRHVLIWVRATLLIKWKVNLGNFPAESETGTPFIDIEAFKLNLQLSFLLNFKRFDVSFTFFMQMLYYDSTVLFFFCCFSSERYYLLLFCPFLK